MEAAFEFVANFDGMGKVLACLDTKAHIRKSNPSFGRSPPGALANLKDSCKNRARQILYDARVSTCLNTHVEYDGMKDY